MIFIVKHIYTEVYPDFVKKKKNPKTSQFLLLFKCFFCFFVHNCKLTCHSASTGNLYFVLVIIVSMEKEIMHIKNSVENRLCEMFSGSSGQVLYHTYICFHSRG